MSPTVFGQQSVHKRRNLFSLGQLLLCQLLLRHLFLCWFFILNFGDNILFFREDHFQVAWCAHVRVDSAVSAVCSAPHVRSTVNLSNISKRINTSRTHNIQGLCCLSQQICQIRLETCNLSVVIKHCLKYHHPILSLKENRQKKLPGYDQ